MGWWSGVGWDDISCVNLEDNSMARMTRRSFRGSRRIARRSGRQYRWAVSVVDDLTIIPGTFQAVDLLSPNLPPTTIADTIYQQMTHPTLIAVMGHVTILADRTYTAGSTVNAEYAPYAWGIYADKDIAAGASSIPPYGLGFTSTWMVHKSGIITTPGVLANAAGMTTLFDQSGSIRRHELNLRRYKRKLDSFNDTLVFSVENASASGNVNLNVSFFLRMLLLE